MRIKNYLLIFMFLLSCSTTDPNKKESFIHISLIELKNRVNQTNDDLVVWRYRGSDTSFHFFSHQRQIMLWPSLPRYFKIKVEEYLIKDTQPFETGLALAFTYMTTEGNYGHDFSIGIIPKNEAMPGMRRF